MKKYSMAVLCLVTMTAMLAYAQSADEGFQMATVSQSTECPADAQHPENADRYKISMRLGNTIYSCHANGSPAVFLGWSPNKEFPARLDGNKLLQVKSPNGHREPEHRRQEDAQVDGDRKLVLQKRQGWITGRWRCSLESLECPHADRLAALPNKSLRHYRVSHFFE